MARTKQTAKCPKKPIVEPICPDRPIATKRNAETQTSDSEINAGSKRLKFAKTTFNRSVFPYTFNFLDSPSNPADGDLDHCFPFPQKLKDIPYFFVSTSDEQISRLFVPSDDYYLPISILEESKRRSTIYVTYADWRDDKIPTLVKNSNPKIEFETSDPTINTLAPSDEDDINNLPSSEVYNAQTQTYSDLELRINGKILATVKLNV